MTNLTFEQITEIITREMMEQYEQVRRLCSKFCRQGLDSLAEVYEEHYSLIWQNFGKLMAYYGITQPHQETNSAGREIQ